MHYKVSAAYTPKAEGGIAWDDPDLASNGLTAAEILVSEKDAMLPRLRDLAPIHWERLPASPGVTRRRQRIAL